MLPKKRTIRELLVDSWWIVLPEDTMLPTTNLVLRRKSIVMERTARFQDQPSIELRDRRLLFEVWWHLWQSVEIWFFQHEGQDSDPTGRWWYSRHLAWQEHRRRRDQNTKWHREVLPWEMLLVLPLMWTRGMESRDSMCRLVCQVGWVLHMGSMIGGVSISGPFVVVCRWFENWFVLCLVGLRLQHLSLWQKWKSFSDQCWCVCIELTWSMVWSSFAQRWGSVHPLYCFAKLKPECWPLAGHDDYRSWIMQWSQQ